MLVGEVADAAGKKHKVSFTTTEQNEQLIALVSPAPLRLSVEKSVIGLAPGRATDLKVRVNLQRDPALRGPVKLDLLVPPHIHGISAASLTAAADATTAELTLSCAADSGPFNLPLTIRGTAEHQGEPLIAETPLTLVPRP
jgi:hypothetical protein